MTPDEPAVGTARTLALLTDIVIPAGVILAGIGLTLMLTGRDEQSPGDDGQRAASLTLAPLVGPGFVGLGAGGTF